MSAFDSRRTCFRKAVGSLCRVTNFYSIDNLDGLNNVRGLICAYSVDGLNNVRGLTLAVGRISNAGITD